MILRLTETRHYIQPRRGDFSISSGCVTIFPGLVEESYLCRELSSEFVDRLIRTGRLIPQP